MNLEQARQVALAVDARPLAPPPRRITDILDVLRQPGHVDASRRDELQTAAAAQPPPAAGDGALAAFYMQRGRAAQILGKGRQALADYRRAYRLAQRSVALGPDLLFHLGSAEANNDNIHTAIELIRKSLDINPKGRNYLKLLNLYLRMGDFEAAARIQSEGLQASAQRIAGARRKGRSTEKEKIFGAQRRQADLSRAAALHETMLAMIDREVFVDPQSRRPAAAYAHPFFWAPFVLVGDSRRGP